MHWKHLKNTGSSRGSGLVHGASAGAILGEDMDMIRCRENNRIIEQGTIEQENSERMFNKQFSILNVQVRVRIITINYGVHCSINLGYLFQSHQYK